MSDPPIGKAGSPERVFYEACDVLKLPADLRARIAVMFTRDEFEAVRRMWWADYCFHEDQRRYWFGADGCRVAVVVRDER